MARGKATEAAGSEVDSRPARFLIDAMAAVLEGEPDRPIALTKDVYVRASYLVESMAPEALERAKVYTRLNIEPQSIAADAVERIGRYTRSVA